ncbi:unnamed protein product, partial [Symbiodinium pilosum]
MQALMVCEPLPALKDFLESEDAALQREGSTIIANIVAFGGPHVNEVIDTGCAALMIQLLRTTADEETQRSAARGAASLAKRGALAVLPQLGEAATVDAILRALQTGLESGSLGTVRATVDFLEEVQCGLQHCPAKAAGAGRSLLEDVSRTCPDIAVVNKVKRILQTLQSEE